jgi:DNA helicase HerA-like ATPase
MMNGRSRQSRDGLRVVSPGETLALVSAPTRHLGMVTGGSLSKGLEIRLDGSVSVEGIAVGRYLTIDGNTQRFFGMVTDVELRALSPQIVAAPPAADDEFLREVLHGTAAYAVLKVSPMLSVGPTADAKPEPVKTVPPHFSGAREASQAEVEQIFGSEDAAHFVIGSPLDMDVTVCLDYTRFIERSNGVFGKTGTGKTFLTRLILLHLVQKSNQQRERGKRCANLIFDMHNEYGWQGTSEGASGKVKGLKQIVGSNVLIMTLDEDNARRRQLRPDGVVTIPFSDVEPADIEILQETLNLTANAVEATHQLERRYGRRWLQEALKLNENDEETAADLVKIGIHPATMVNLRRGLLRLSRNKFMVEKADGGTLQTIIENLLAGRTVVLEFGEYGSQLASYMLVANILTRRIYERFRDLMERALANDAEKPNHLVITIEEAHKFLNPRVAGQTIFGEIAREMRKYNVSLLVIDQRPSAIDDEVLSQIGTRFVCLLDNERDVDAVLSGVSGKSELRSVVAKLESRQQALILGHAVPMPIVVRPTDYEDSYAGFERSLVGSADDLWNDE